jgi:hypothetical protein
MTEKVLCKTTGCNRDILPSTAERTGGYCMPCFQRQQALERRAFIEKNRVDVDLFRGVTDPVEILMLLHCPPPADPLKNYLPYSGSMAELYRKLSLGDRERLLGEIGSDADLYREVASHLAVFSSLDLASIQEHLLDVRDPYPDYAFRSAPESVVRRLIDMITGRCNALHRDHALRALAWTRHPEAEKAFITWQKSPPRWAQRLHVPVHRYTEAAGCEVRASGIKTLYSEVCYRLAPTSSAAAAIEPKTVRLCDPAPEGESCPICSYPVTVLLDFDAAQIGIQPPRRTSSRLAIVTCDRCVAYRVVCADTTRDAGHWILPQPEHGQPPDGDSSELVPHRAVLDHCRKPWEAVDWCIADGLSQVGGLPSWIQQPSYPECPTCGHRMPFVGQVAFEDISDLGEGIVYAFVCERCGLTATTFQQS